jgi:hypothetical protein
MRPRPRVLWIEDQATTDLMELAAQVYATCRYDFTIARNVTEGVDRLREHHYDVVIVDVRLEPGSSPDWINYYKQRRYDKLAARLGLVLLYCLLKPKEAPGDVHLHIPASVENGTTRFGVLTVESPQEMDKDLKALKIRVYRQKTERTPSTVLVEMIEALLAERGGKEPHP